MLVTQPYGGRALHLRVRRPATLGEDETLGEVRLPVVHAKAGARAAAADGAFLLGYNPGAGRVERIAPARWVALSRSGRDVGELRVRAWLDEEYFHRRRNDAVAAVTATLRDARFAGDAAKVPYRRPSGQEDRRRPTYQKNVSKTVVVSSKSSVDASSLPESFFVDAGTRSSEWRRTGRRSRRARRPAAESLRSTARRCL